MLPILNDPTGMSNEASIESAMKAPISHFVNRSKTKKLGLEWFMQQSSLIKYPVEHEFRYLQRLNKQIIDSYVCVHPTDHRLNSNLEERTS